jgi:hypothetical protein
VRVAGKSGEGPWEKGGKKDPKSGKRDKKELLILSFDFVLKIKNSKVKFYI